MSNLKTGRSKAVALACCGIFALSCVGFAELDRTEIAPCDVLPSVEYKADHVSVTTTVTTENAGEITVSEEIKTEIVTTSAAEKNAKETTVKETAVPESETTSVRSTGGVKRIYAAQTNAVPTGTTTAAETSLTKAETTAVPESTNKTETSSEETFSSSEAVPVTTVSSKVTEPSVSSEATSETTKATTRSTAKATTAETTVKTTTIKKTTTSEETATTTTKDTTTTSKKTTTTTTSKPTTTTTPAITTQATTTPETTVLPQKPVTDNGTTPETRFNAAKLTPDQCLTGKDHKILTKYLDKIITDDMSNYEKALACYDYLIKNTYYDYGGWSDPVKAVLEDGYGTCTEYSRVYAYMLRYIGFDAKTVDGMTAMAAGGYGYHMWVEVTINGQVYVCDAQVDDNMSSATKISHARFCKTYDEVKGQYIKA